MIKKAIITAAGFGSRFLPITKTFPKEMLPIIDKPILHYLVEECGEAGIEEVIIVASPAEVSKFEDYFYGRATNIRTLMIRQGKLDRWSKVEKIFELPSITIVPQDDRLPYGNGRPILTVKDLVENEEAFAVLFGDDMFLSDVSAIKQLTDYYNSNKCDVLLGVKRMPKSHLTQGGVIKVKEETDNEVDAVVEKPSLEELEADSAFTDLYSFGRYIVTPKIFEYLLPDATGKDNELWLQDANDKVAQNGKVYYLDLDGEFYTTGDPIKYLKAHIKYFLKHAKEGDELRNWLKEIS
ncbi:NTP transferase domain-containing protein [Candidatus Dojkabacteria bacterium]|nr:NTP transferase domain-containing protein [Candidatus Dojkabacteria bacterium]